MSERAKKGLIAAGFLLVGVVALWLVLTLASLPSEISNIKLIGIVVGLVVVSLAIVWGGLKCVQTKPRRFALAGAGLLVLGVLLAYAMLPEKSAPPLASAVSVLPPFPGKSGQGFALGLAASPEGCANSVPFTLVVDWPKAYWSDRPWLRDKPQRYVLVLPGRLTKVSVALGLPGSTSDVKDPKQARVDLTANNMVQERPATTLVGAVEQRELTILDGYALGWASEDRPLIIKARAPWITHRGLGDCNLQLPALLGEASVSTLIRAFSCAQIEHMYARNACANQASEVVRSGLKGTQRAHRITLSVARYTQLPEAGNGVSMVDAGSVASPDSDPQPTTLYGSPSWKCRSASGAIGAEDCHAFATVVVSPWHRDFLLALIGAFVAVGVHMLFQAMVDHGPDGSSSLSELLNLDGLGLGRRGRQDNPRQPQGSPPEWKGAPPP